MIFVIFLIFSYTSQLLADEHTTLYEEKHSTLQGSVELRHHTHQYRHTQERPHEKVQAQIRSTMRFQKGRIRLYGTWGLTKNPADAKMASRPYELELNILAAPFRYLQTTGYGIFKQRDHDHLDWGGVYQIGWNTSLKIPLFRLGGSWHSLTSFDASALMWLRPTNDAKIPGTLRNSLGFSWQPQLSFPTKMTWLAGQSTRLAEQPSFSNKIETSLSAPKVSTHYRIRSEITLAKDIHLLYDFFHYFDGYFEKAIVEGRQYKHILRTVITF
ncbi:MAG: hypothetical protein AB8C84_06880 [Oligoflexales bacterium]